MPVSMAARQVIHLDDPFDPEGPLIWRLYECLDDTTNLLAPLVKGGDWIPLTTKSDGGTIAASLSPEQTILATRVLLGGVKKKSTKHEDRVLFENVIRKIL